MKNFLCTTAAWRNIISRSVCVCMRNYKQPRLLLLCAIFPRLHGAGLWSVCQDLCHCICLCFLSHWFGLWLVKSRTLSRVHLLWEQTNSWPIRSQRDILAGSLTLTASEPARMSHVFFCEVVLYKVFRHSRGLCRFAIFFFIPIIWKNMYWSSFIKFCTSKTFNKILLSCLAINKDINPSDLIEWNTSGKGFRIYNHIEIKQLNRPNLFIGT